MEILPKVEEINKCTASIDATRGLIQECEIKVPSDISKEEWEFNKEFEATGDPNYKVTLPNIKDDVSRRDELVSEHLPPLFRREYQDTGNLFIHYLTCNEDALVRSFKKNFFLRVVIVVIILFI